MTALRRHRLCMARWLAGLLMLAALAPAMARTLAFAQGQIAPWGLLCSASGQGLPSPSEDGSAARVLDQCALCVLAAHAVALPGGDGQIRVAPPMAFDAKVGARIAPSPTQAWRHDAPARAPPRAV